MIMINDPNEHSHKMLKMQKRAFAGKLLLYLSILGPLAVFLTKDCGIEVSDCIWTTVILCFLFSLVASIYLQHNWRCPICRKSLKGNVSPVFCPECGVRFAEGLQGLEEGSNHREVRGHFQSGNIDERILFNKRIERKWKVAFLVFGGVTILLLVAFWLPGVQLRRIEAMGVVFLAVGLHSLYNYYYARCPRCEDIQHNTKKFCTKCGLEAKYPQ